MAGSLINRRSALHARHVALGATMPEREAWQLPEHYGFPDDEAQRVRAGVGACDISSIGKLDLTGSALSTFLQPRCAPRPVPDLGHVERISEWEAGAGPARDAHCYRLASDHAFVTLRGPAAGQASASQPADPTTCIHLTDVTSTFTALQLAGPLSHELLTTLTPLDLGSRRFPAARCAEGSLAGVHVLIVHMDLGPHLAYELYCRRELGEYLWETLHDAGREHGIVPFGQAALRLLQSEG